ncbi:DUF397 domain-containing protein [Lipingzhangella sp. LS1_29]|uniref:DUF397 domain-containing protein n=1 Tax=Lipingzhangella rawalii TaxID=2055835 RepID=A0ABU2H856_9ACTN|nr:DUF397 domain-containing protein [Lipingzhangella rawalii]MDS1271484.1 DUF397 domain-containing protein [Lipingzhangella rawalii]
MPETSHSLHWRKSSFSGSTTQNCVEIADLPGGTAVRDTQHRDHGYLEFPATEWRALLADIKDGRL